MDTVYIHVSRFDSVKCGVSDKKNLGRSLSNCSYHVISGLRQENVRNSILSILPSALESTVEFFGSYMNKAGQILFVCLKPLINVSGQNAIMSLALGALTIMN